VAPAVTEVVIVPGPIKAADITEYNTMELIRDLTGIFQK
jgi:hypothetical protein